MSSDQKVEIMAMNANDVLDLTKENIQPLRNGRKAAQLKTALQAQIDPETQHQLYKQREQYEYKIRMYEGDDPLSPYYEYVVWLEQSFPKMGRESNIMSVIEDTIIKFKDYEKYKQDLRFVKLMIKYISAQSNPLELYQEVYGRGLGTMCSMLYKAWAEELDKHNDFKRANQVFQQGISCRAQPLQELEDAHIQFQLSIARRMLEGNMNEAPEGSGRNVLSKLPTNKVKTNRFSKDSAGVLQSNVRSDANKGFNFSTPKFKVFEEIECDNGLGDFKSKHNKLPKGSVSDRENMMKASKWCGQKQKQAFKMPSTPVTPSFPVHEDPEVECKTKMSVLRPRALKMKKEEFNCPVAVFEPPDPTKMTMYPKQKVYVGGRDMQLEEIRAAYYWKNIKKLVEKKQIQEPGVDMDVSEEPVDLTKSSNSSVDQRPDLLAQNENQTCVLGPTKYISNEGRFIPPPVPCAANSFNLEQSALPTFIKPAFHHPCSERRPSMAVSRRSDAFMSRANVYDRKSEYMDIISQRELLGERNHEAHSMKAERPQVAVSCDAPLYKFNSAENRERNTANQSDKFDSSSKFQKSEEDVHDFRASDRNNISAFHHSPSTSITINTRAAMNVIQKMWESPLAPQAPRSQVNEDFGEFKLPMPHKSRNVYGAGNDSDGIIKSFAPFDVFAEETLPQLNNAKKSQVGLPFPVYADESIHPFSRLQSASSTAAATSVPFFASKSSKLPFPVFCEEAERREHRRGENMGDDDDFFGIPFTKPKITVESAPLDEDLARPMGSLRMSEVEPRTPLPFIVPVNLQETPLEPENKENQPPKDYSTPSERRPLSGILTPATDVPVRELNAVDSDEDDSSWQVHGRDNDFDESCNTRAFAIRLPSSTPSSRPEYSRAARQSFICNGSYISEEVAGPSVTTQASSANGATASQAAACSKNAANLSLILENSKEQGSSSSSGNSANVISKNFL